VTVRPGLIGALLVGVAAAKGLAYARALPLVPVNHLEGHVAAAYLTDPDLQPPFVALIASGGHTALYFVYRDRRMRLLGETLDDAAGEALDKGARMLGLGFPGGPAISEAARDGDRDSYDFPVGLKSKDNLDFSFSGLKTSLLYKLKPIDGEQLCEELPHLAASYEAAVVEALSRKLLRAVDLHDSPAVVVAGGVAANTLLRRTVEERCAKIGTRLVVPPPELCTDNAAMIGAAAASARAVPYPEYLSLSARSVGERFIGGRFANRPPMNPWQPLRKSNHYRSSGLRIRSRETCSGDLLGRLRVAERAEDPVSFVAGENGAPRAYHTGRVQILRMVLDVEQNYLLGDPVEDVLRAPATARARSFFTAQLLWQSAQTRYPVGTKDA
jgi:N6-L-threonylcarbamoyladenine synthase